MLHFKNIELKDVNLLKRYIFSPARFSCETNIINLLVWQKMYDNMYAIYDDMLFIKSGTGSDETFRLPFGENLEKGFEILRKHTGKEYPPLWVQQGERFLDFNLKYGEGYDFLPERDAFDYIYLQEDLANLSGKKYHSKRNHITAFSKKYNWEYKEICEENIPDVLECMNKWYESNAERFDRHMQCEKDGINLILNNMDLLSAKGGAIYIDKKVVAFTLGSPINCNIFDIHIEKALPEYATAYTVINNEFAKTLGDYKYINREDDLGLEGLRKAKLSYKPNILLKKYLCLSFKDRCKQIYSSAFPEDDKAFLSELFGECFKYCEVLKKDDKIVSLCFAFPCEIDGKSAKYIFGLTTGEEYRNNGYAIELLEKLKSQNDILLLRPSDNGLVEFYKKVGFCEFTATNEKNNFALIPKAEYSDLANKNKEDSGTFIAMYYNKENKNFNNLYFPYSMP